jgi:hypothetical protein
MSWIGCGSGSPIRRSGPHFEPTCSATTSGNIRLAFLTGIALWLSWGVLLRPYIGALADLRLDMIIRFGVFVPMLIVGLGITFTPFFDRIWEWVSVAIAAATIEFEERDVHVAALLHMWERAGLSAPAILAAAYAGTLSLEFLDAPRGTCRSRPMTYRTFAEVHGVPLHLLQSIQGATALAAPDSDDPVAPDVEALAGARPHRGRSRRLRRRDPAPLPRVRGQRPTSRDGRGRRR